MTEYILKILDCLMWGKWNKEVEALIEIMKEVIPFAIKVQKDLDQTEYKHKTDGSIVSICDFAIQALIMRHIHSMLPKDDVFGEEEINKVSTEFLQSVKQILLEDIDLVEVFSKSIRKINKENHRTWVIDPIDGTEGFVHHSNYAIATCLFVDLIPQVSVTAWPLHDPKYTGIDMKGPLIFIAIEGDKSYVIDLQNNIKIMPVIKTPQKAHLTNNTIGYRQQYIKRHLRIQKTISLISMVKGFVLASGKANVYIRMHNEAENAWDIAPFEIFLRNCGGMITLGNGDSIKYLPDGKIKGSANAGIICTIGGEKWHDEVLKVFRNCRITFAFYRILAYFSIFLLLFIILNTILYK